MAHRTAIANQRQRQRVPFWPSVSDSRRHSSSPKAYPCPGPVGHGVPEGELQHTVQQVITRRGIVGCTSRPTYIRYIRKAKLIARTLSSWRNCIVGAVYTFPGDLQYTLSFQYSIVLFSWNGDEKETMQDASTPHRVRRDDDGDVVSSLRDYEIQHPASRKLGDQLVLILCGITF